MHIRFTVIALAATAMVGCGGDVKSGLADTESSETASPGPSTTPALRPGSYYVIDEVKERLAPTHAAAITNTLHRRQRVDVYEVRDGWARISRSYIGAVEGQHGSVARWIPTDKLSSERPTELEQPRITGDPRIQGLPNVGEGGLTAIDVQILHGAAQYFLETGKAAKIEYGDKSVNRAGVYYLNFGGPANHFFRPEDIPNLEARIRNVGGQPDAFR